MHKLRLADLNPIERQDLKELLMAGTVPRLKTLGLFVQLGFLEPTTFRVRAGVIDELVKFERDRKHPPTHVLTPLETLRALRARKDPPIL